MNSDLQWKKNRSNLYVHVCDNNGACWLIVVSNHSSKLLPWQWLVISCIGGSPVQWPCLPLPVLVNVSGQALPDLDIVKTNQILGIHFECKWPNLK